MDLLKNEFDSLRPIADDRLHRLMQKLRLDWNYHSNSIEGNTLSASETKAFILHGITAKGKPFRDYLEMRGHNEALKKVEEIVHKDINITESLIKDLHKIILVEPYTDSEAEINPGKYKTKPNYLYSPENERIDFVPPNEVASKMNELVNWLNNHLDPPKRKKKQYDAHPLLIASYFHWQFIRIHPFGDGNGRMARILMNLILMICGYVPAIVRLEKRKEYYGALNLSEADNITPLAEFIGEESIASLELALKAAKGENIEKPDDFDREIALLKQMQNIPEQKLKMSKTVIDNVLKSVYFPLLNSLDTRLSKLNELFKYNTWTYFEEPKAPDYSQKILPSEASLKNIQAYFKSIVNKNDGHSRHHFKASYLLDEYKDLNNFSLEIALKIFFEEESYCIEAIVCKPNHSSDFIQTISEGIKLLLKDSDKTDNELFKINRIEFPTHGYNQTVSQEEIEKWVDKIANETLIAIREKALSK